MALQLWLTSDQTGAHLLTSLQSERCHLLRRGGRVQGVPGPALRVPHDEGPRAVPGPRAQPWPGAGRLPGALGGLYSSQVVTDTSTSMMDMESLAPSRRGCRFPWEVEELTFHSTYSLATCRCTTTSPTCQAGVWAEGSHGEGGLCAVVPPTESRTP